MISQQPLSLIRSVFGDPFVAYALNSESEEIDTLQLSPARNDAISFLAGVIGQGQQLASQNGPDSEPWDYLPTVIQFLSGFRARCGGDLPVINAADKTEHLVLQCVREILPALLIPPPQRYSFYFRAGLQNAILSLPVLGLLANSLLQDPSLRKLFADKGNIEALDELEESKKSHVSTDLWWLSQQGGSTWVAAVASHLVLYVVVRATIRGCASFSDASSYASEGLKLARRLAEEKAADVPVFVSLSNINFADGVQSINTAWGEIFRPSPMALALLREAGAWENRGARDIAAIMEIRATDQLVHKQYRWPDPELPDVQTWFDSWAQKVETAHHKLQGDLHKVRYALLLSSSVGERVAAMAEAVTYMNPLAQNTPAPIAWAQFLSGPPATIDSEVARAAEQWSQRVEVEHPASLDIGMRRLLSAATLRLDPMDGFIDAVMCWENLFGEAQETTFKVCGALAKLLEPGNSSRRDELFRELKKLYDIRSKLVHGSREPDRKTAVNHQERAVAVALDAMRAAYDYPGLLQLKDASERYKRILLGLT